MSTILVLAVCSAPQKEERKIEEKPREARASVSGSPACGNPSQYSFSAALKDENGSPVPYKRAYLYGFLTGERSDVKVCEASQECSFTISSDRPCTSVKTRAVFYLEDGTRKIAEE
ncbi:MAG: hypothetical protein HS115_06195 [Spirochaetales bacterium]|nr:hypothetical protein [Spirochaetales bacterium]